MTSLVRKSICYDEFIKETFSYFGRLDICERRWLSDFATAYYAGGRVGEHRESHAIKDAGHRDVFNRFVRVDVEAVAVDDEGEADYVDPARSLRDCHSYGDVAPRSSKGRRFDASDYSAAVVTEDAIVTAIDLYRSGKHKAVR